MFHAVPFMAQLGSNIPPQSQSIPGHCLPRRARGLLINNGTARAAAGPTPRPRPLEGRQLCGETEALRSSPAVQAGEWPSARGKGVHRGTGCRPLPAPWPPCKVGPTVIHPSGCTALTQHPTAGRVLLRQAEVDGRPGSDQGHSPWSSAFTAFACASHVSQSG